MRLAGGCAARRLGFWSELDLLGPNGVMNRSAGIAFPCILFLMCP